VVGRRRAQKAQPLPAGVEEAAVVVRVLRQGLDAQQFAAHQQVVVDRQLAPGLDANTRRSGVVISEGRVSAGQAAQGGARQHLPRRVEHLDVRVQGRAQPAGVYLDQLVREAVADAEGVFREGQHGAEGLGGKDAGAGPLAQLTAREAFVHGETRRASPWRPGLV
jgi:hypothetical protein